MSVDMPLVLLGNMHPPCATDLDSLRKVSLITSLRYTLGDTNFVAWQLLASMQYTAVADLTLNRSPSPTSGSKPVNADLFSSHAGLVS